MITNNSGKDLLVIIEENYRNFSKGHKAIATYILGHYEKAAFMTAVKLGAAVGKSESTVVRFAFELGFDGYPKLQKALQDVVRNKMTSTQRIAITEEKDNSDELLRSVMNSDVMNIRETMANININNFNACVETILSSRRIYIIGVRSSSAMAGFLSFYFNYMFDDVRLVSTNTASEVFEQVIKAGEGDVLIGISFPRYSKRTVKAMQYAHSQGTKVIAITDSEISPIVKYADYALYAKSDMVSFVDSLTAPLSIINALIVTVGMKRKDDISRSFDKLEHIWDEYEVYEKPNEG